MAKAKDRVEVNVTLTYLHDNNDVREALNAALDGFDGANLGKLRVDRVDTWYKDDDDN